MEKLKQLSNSTVVYKGIQEFKEGAERIDVAALPGLIQSGWDPKTYVIFSIADGLITSYYPYLVTWSWRPRKIRKSWKKST